MLRPLGIEYIPRLAAGFLKANPGQDIQFTFHTGVTQYLLDGLAARKYDLVFCSQPSEEHKFTAIPILERLYSELGISGEKNTTDDMLFTVETVSCLGACGLAPVLTVNDTVYPKMTPDAAAELIHELRGA